MPQSVGWKHCRFMYEYEYSIKLIQVQNMAHKGMYGP